MASPSLLAREPLMAWEQMDQNETVETKGGEFLPGISGLAYVSRIPGLAFGIITRLLTSANPVLASHAATRSSAL